MWGIIPAAGNGMRILSLAFSKELLPVGSRVYAFGIERPRAVSEYLVGRMTRAGADKICFVISPWKSDILQYYGASIGGAHISYVILGEEGRALEIQVKSMQARSRWIWGAFKMPGNVLHALHALWLRRDRKDGLICTLVNAWIPECGVALGVCSGRRYVDVGTLGGYREALQLLAGGPSPKAATPEAMRWPMTAKPRGERYWNKNP